MSKKQIVIVESPFQLINSLEYLKEKEIPNHCVKFYLIDLLGKANKLQLKKIGEIFSLEYEIINLYNPKKFFRQLNIFLFFIKSYFFYKFQNSCTYLIFGNSKSPVSIGFSNIISPKKLVLVDDGTASIRDVEDILLENKVSIEKNAFFYFYKIIGIDTVKFDLNEIFSSYDFKNGNKSNINLVKNKGILLKKSIRRANKNTNVYFIGGPLVESGLISQEDFLMVISHVAKHKNMKGKNVYYFPHRRETKNILESINSVTGWSIKKGLESPFELSLLDCGIPLEVASFFSSVLGNMKTYNVDTKITSYVIPQKLFLKNRIFYQSIYDNYLNQSIELVSDFIDND